MWRLYVVIPAVIEGIKDRLFALWDGIAALLWPHRRALWSVLALLTGLMLGVRLLEFIGA